MTPERYQALKEVFLAARDLSTDERAAQLDQRCGDDASLRAAVERLLAAHDTGERLGVVPFPADDDKGTTPYHVEYAQSPRAAGRGHPNRIGRYRIRGILGEGGMGTVYEAQQESPRRTVALKVIRAGVISKQMLRRFEHEAQLLGRLQHAGIAQILEAGLAETGHGRQPFFAMEFVRGKPITEHANSAALGTRQRLGLLAKVCAAVEHAHQKGVIHRDLKPGNILVDESGQPKILDFGVARATDSDIQTTTLRTDIGQLIGTVPYMSPEQVTGDPALLDTRSDVYSLGVLGYELLTGRLPHDLSGKTIPEAVRIIREDRPTRLSTVNRVFRGDLETIFTKALEKDKERRYQSSSQLGADIRHYLRNEPILARPPSATYQLRKLVARHKLPFAFAALLFLAVTTFAVVATVQAVRISEQAVRIADERDKARVAGALAEERRAQAEQARTNAERQAAITEAVVVFLTDDMLGSVNPERALGHDVTVLEVLDQAAEQIKGALADEPEVQAAIRVTIGNTYCSLGEYPEAERHLRAALEIRGRVLGKDHPHTLNSMDNLAGVLRALGKLDEAEPLSRRALELHRRVQGDEHPNTLTSMQNLAALLYDRGKLSEAEPLFRLALETQRRVLGEEHPSTLNTMNNLAAVLQAQGEFSEAEPYYREALETQRRIHGDEHPKTLTSMENLGTLLQAQGKLSAAEPLYRQALEGCRRVLGDEHPSTLNALNSMASLLQDQGKLAEAEPLHRQALQSRRRIGGDEHPATLNSMNNLAGLLATQGRLDEAELLYRQTLAGRRRLLGDEHRNTLTSMNNLAGLLQRRGKLDEAESWCRQALEIAQRLLGAEHPGTLGSMVTLAQVLKAQGRLDEAEALVREALAICRPTHGDEHPRTLGLLNGLAVLLREQGKLAEAEPLFHGVAETAERVLPSGHYHTAMFRRDWGECLTGLERYAEAEVQLLASYEALTAALGEDHAFTHGAIELLIDLYDAWGKPDEAEEYRTLISEASASEATSTGAPEGVGGRRARSIPRRLPR